MLLNILVIGFLGFALRRTGRPAVYGLLYFVILFSLGLMRGNPLRAQVLTAFLFSILPFIAFLLMSRFKDSIVVYIVLTVGAAAANDVLQYRFNKFLSERRDKPARAGDGLSVSRAAP